MDWTQIVSSLIAGAALVLAARASRGAAAVKRIENRTDEIHDQVRNSHTTNLRIDIDEIKSDARAAREGADAAAKAAKSSASRMDRLSEDIGGIKDDVKALDERLTQHLDGR